MFLKLEQDYFGHDIWWGRRTLLILFIVNMWLLRVTHTVSIINRKLTVQTPPPLYFLWAGWFCLSSDACFIMKISNELRPLKNLNSLLSLFCFFFPHLLLEHKSQSYEIFMPCDHFLFLGYYFRIICCLIHLPMELLRCMTDTEIWDLMLITCRTR